MTEFDDLNAALAALKSEMRTATTATQAVSRLGQAANAMANSTKSINKTLRAFESEVKAVDASIANMLKALDDLSVKTVREWDKKAQKYLDAATLTLEQQSKTVSNHLTDCQAHISSFEESIKIVSDKLNNLSTKTQDQWEASFVEIMRKTGCVYVDTVSNEIKSTFTDFTSATTETREDLVREINKQHKITEKLLTAQVDRINSIGQAVSEQMKDTAKNLDQEFDNHREAAVNLLKSHGDQINKVCIEVFSLKKLIEHYHDTLEGAWQKAARDIMDTSSQKHIAAIENMIGELKRSSSAELCALRNDWSHREATLKRAKRWAWSLGFLLFLATAVIAAAISYDLFIK